MAHTLGPWRIELANQFTDGNGNGVPDLDLDPIWMVVTGQGDTFNVVAEFPYDAPKENASLIAAAPDLLAELKAIVAGWSRKKERDRTEWERERLEYAREAVAYAEGREP